MQWIQSAEDLERSRAVRFRPEWRPLLLDYFGLSAGMRVLEVCCGPGTLAPYLAAAVGHVTGLDLGPAFIARAQASAPANVDYVVGDACALPFAAAAFDAVLSYTGVGILDDPERAVAEMIRVCRPGGLISVCESVTGPDGIRFAGIDSLGGELWPGAGRHHRLRRPVAAPALGSRRWPVGAILALLAHMGLTDLRLNAWGYVQAPDLTGGRDEPQPLPRAEWLKTHPAYDWVAGLSLVASGRTSTAQAPGR